MLKKLIIVIVVLMTLFLFTGCFLVELILPPLEGGTARIAVYMHYSGINKYAHRLSALKMKVENVEFSGKSEDVDKTVEINFRPAQTVNNPSDLVGILSQYQIGQFIFENEDEQEIENPVLDITLSPAATVSYMIEIEDEEEETTESTDVRYLIEDTTLSLPLKVLTSSFSTKGRLSLPVGQSTLFVLLDLKDISTYEEASSTGTTSSSTAISLENSFSMMKDDTTVIYGQIEDNTGEEEDPALIPGQDWTLDFYDALYLGESNRFSTLSYPLSEEWSSSSNQHYFLMVPRGDYNPGVYLRAPGEEDDDEYSVELDLNNDDESKNAGTLEYPDEGE